MKAAEREVVVRVIARAIKREVAPLKAEIERLKKAAGITDTTEAVAVRDAIRENMQ